MQAIRAAFWLLLWLSLGLAGCGASASPTPAPTTLPATPTSAPTASGAPLDLDGLFEAGFEFSRFIPCGSQEIWLVSWADMAVFDQYERLTAGQRQPVYVRLQGRAAAPSAAERSLDDYVGKVEQATLLEMRMPAPGECR